MAKKEYRYLENLSLFEGYHRADHQFCQFKNYNLTYTFYERPQSERRPEGYIWGIARHSLSPEALICCDYSHLTWCENVSIWECDNLELPKCGCDVNQKHIHYNGHYLVCYNYFFKQNYIFQILKNASCRIVFLWISHQAKRKYWMYVNLTSKVYE